MITYIGNCKLTKIEKPIYKFNLDYFNFQIIKEIEELDVKNLTEICIITKEIIKIVNNMMINNIKFILFIKSTNIYYQIGDIYFINQIQKIMANRVSLNIGDIINNESINNNNNVILNMIDNFIGLDKSDLNMIKIEDQKVPLLIFSCFNISNFTIFNNSILHNNTINQKIINYVYENNPTNIDLRIVMKYIKLLITSNYIIEKKLKIFKKNIIWNFEEENIES